MRGGGRRRLTHNTRRSFGSAPLGRLQHGQWKSCLIIIVDKKMGLPSVRQGRCESRAREVRVPPPVGGPTPEGARSRAAPISASWRAAFVEPRRRRRRTILRVSMVGKKVAAARTGLAGRVAPSPPADRGRRARAEFRDIQRRLAWVRSSGECVHACACAMGTSRGHIRALAL
jgi:hypothetical protein